MFVNQVVWDDPSNPDGNAASLTSHGYTLDDLESILYEPTNRSSLLEEVGLEGIGGVIYGTTQDGRPIGIVWESLCGNPLHIYPVSVIRLDRQSEGK